MFYEAKLKLTEMYNCYRAYYDYEAEVSPLHIFLTVLCFNPKHFRQLDFAGKTLSICAPLCRIEFLTDSFHIFRKVGTNYTQCVNRICLITVTPQDRVDNHTVHQL